VVNGREKSSIGDKDARRTLLGLAACARLGNKGLTPLGRVKSEARRDKTKQSNGTLKLLQAEKEAKERMIVRVYHISSVVGIPHKPVYHVHHAFFLWL
jgi:hypothetical protein